MADINGGTIRYILRGDDRNLTKLLNDVTNNARSMAGQFQNVTVDVKQATNAISQQETAALRTAQAQARLLTEQGRYSQAARVLGNALVGVNQSSIQAINTQTQLARVNNLAAKGANTLTNSVKGLSKEIGFFGGLFLAGQITNFFGDLLNSANELEKVQAKVRALSKTQEEYAATIALAKEQQNIFGGSLTENLDSLGAFLNLSQRTGVQLKDLENLARRLAIIDPIQGFSGAAVALKEFFSGDITSLSRRFEINRSALNSLKQIEDPIERFRELDKVVSDLGFTQEVLISQTQTTAITYDRAAAAFDNAKVAVGSYIAEILKVPTQVVTEVILKRIAEDLPQALPENIQTEKLEAGVNMLESTNSVREFNAEVEKANQVLNQAGLATVAAVGYFQRLSPAMYNAAKAAQDNGVSLQTIIAGANATQPTLSKLASEFERLGTAPGRSVEQIQAVNVGLANLAVSSSEGANQALLLANALLAGKITAEEAIVAMNNITLSNQAATVAMQENALAANLAATGGAAYNTVLQSMGIAVQGATEAITEENEALTEAIAKKQAAKAEALLMKQVEEELARLAPQVANGHITKANAAAQLAALTGLAVSQTEALIDAELRLASAGQRRIAAQNRATTTNGRLSGGSPGRRGTSDVDAVVREIEAQKKAQEELRESERNLAIAQGGRAAEIRLLEQDLAGLNKGTAAYNNTLAQLTQLQEQEAKAAAKGGGGKSPKLSAQEKLNNQLASQQDKYYDKVENEEIKHQQNLLDIQNEYARKQLESQKKSELSKRGSRADFYSNLIEQDSVDQAKFAAQYEEAFAEAQRLAAAGQFELSRELLALRQQQIQDDIDFEKRKQEIIENDDLDKKEKQNRLAALEGVNKLRQDQQAEELKQLREGGDANLNELNAQLTEEELRYAQQTDKITLSAQQAADARIANWERANRAIEASPPAELLAFGPNAVNASNATIQPGTGQLPPQQSEIPATTLPPDQAMNVRIVETAFVRDEGVINELVALGTRLESALSVVQEAINNNTNVLGSKTDNVASAVRNIKFPSLVR